MLDFLESESSSLGPASADPMLAGINGTDELRFASGIGSAADDADIDIERLMLGAEESDSLLVPQSASGALSGGKDKVSGKSLESGKDPLTGETGDATVGEMDTLTGGDSDRVEIETRARKRDKAGNSLKKARNLGVLTDDERIKEFVGKSDRRDIYKFRVNKKTDVDIDLRGLSGNADLYLLNKKGKVIGKSVTGGKRAENIERTLNPGTYYVRVQPRNNRVNANYTLSLGANNPHFHVDEPIIINIVDTAADAPTSLDDSSTIDLMVAYTPEARRAEGGTGAMKKLIEFAVDDANEAFAKSGVRPRLRLVHTAEVNYAESGKSRTELYRLQDPSDGYMDEVHKLRDRYGADIVSLFVGELDDAGGRGFRMGTPAYGFESYAFNVVDNYYAKNRRTLAHEVGHNLGLVHDRDNADGQGAFPYGYGYTTPSGAGTIMSYAPNRLQYFSNPAISYKGEALGRTNLENSALAINKVAQYAANWRQSVDNKTKPKGSTDKVSFSKATNFDAGYRPQSVAVGEFNGDGVSDFLVANTSDSVYVYFGKGNGSFRIATVFDVGDWPGTVAVGEFNGDGISDLAVTKWYYGDNNVSVLLGNGNGSFRNVANFDAGDAPNSVAVGEFNGDGISDLAVTNSWDDSVSVLLGKGNGNFSNATNFDVGNFPRSVAVGEFNGDDISDLAVTNIADDNVSVLLGKGNGSFRNATNFNVGDRPLSVAVGEFNGDGISDLAVTNSGYPDDRFVDSVSVLLGKGNGSFRNAINFDAGNETHSVAVGEFNGDGISDLAVTNEGDDNISVLLGKGNGSFSNVTNFNVGDGPRLLAVGEFNDDGVSDLVVANGKSDNVSILINTT